MVIGVTGGIASGKSTVVSFFKEWGADVIDVDKLGWEILENKQKEVIKTFGKEILIKKSSAEASPLRAQAQKVYPRQTIDRKKLGKLIFVSHEKRRKLDSIVHPTLIKELEKRINSMNSKYLVVDCALIYEWKIEGWFNKIILVTSSYENKLNRLLNSGYTKEEAKNRISAQLPDEAKNPDWVIKNDSSLKTLKEDTKEVWNELIETCRARL